MSSLPPDNMRILFNYFYRDPSAHHTAKFSLYAGSSAEEGVERPVHRAVLAALTPLVLQDPELDAIIIPDGRFWKKFRNLFLPIYIILSDIEEFKIGFSDHHLLSMQR